MTESHMSLLWFYFGSFEVHQAHPKYSSACTAQSYPLLAQEESFLLAQEEDKE